MRRVLDLFCGAGGAGTGYARAGFDVTGVDIEPQPRYPYRFVLGDALEYVEAHGHEYDLIGASPPCQAHTSLQGRWGREYPDLIAPTRDALKATGRPYVIENVPGAPLENPITLCGSMFGLRVIRHRIFETSVPIWFPPSPCSHPRNAVGRRGNEGTREWITVTGHFSNVPKAQQAMGGLDWMTQHDLAQAIPPAYTRWIAEQMTEALAPVERQP
jgi:DNA (cytosine-5)-methyltransferase 1